PGILLFLEKSLLLSRFFLRLSCLRLAGLFTGRALLRGLGVCRSFLCLALLFSLARLLLLHLRIRSRLLHFLSLLLCLLLFTHTLSPFILFKCHIQLAHKSPKSRKHLLVIHPLRSYNTHGSSQASAKIIIGCHHTAVLHALHRGFISDVNLNSSLTILALIYLRYKFLQCFLMLQSTDQLTGLSVLCQLRILENVG